MAFRTLELTSPSEIHIKDSQLTILQGEECYIIPIEDIYQITAIGSNIRISTMDLSILTNQGVAIVTLDNKYLPTSITLPFEGNSRQSQIMHAQVSVSNQKYLELWEQIIRVKIDNQSRGLALLGLKGSERVSSYLQDFDTNNIDCQEALAAKEYFSNYHPGLNRRNDDPVNSRLNYGYSIVRSAIARNLVICGFHPAFGIHHNNQLNLFNLADDLIEPYRAIVDQIAYHNMGANEKLSKNERKNLTNVLFSACSINDCKVNVTTSIELMCESLKRIVLDKSGEKLKLPMILPYELLEDITE